VVFLVSAIFGGLLVIILFILFIFFFLLFFFGGFLFGSSFLLGCGLGFLPVTKLFWRKADELRKERYRSK
jgi:hypothetical protein